MKVDHGGRSKPARRIERDRLPRRRLILSTSLAAVFLGWPGSLMEAQPSPQPAWGSRAHHGTALTGLTSGVMVNSTGRTSRWRLVSTGNRELDEIACPSSRVCYAFGGTGHSAATWRTTMFQTKDAGKTWRAMVIHPAGIPLFHIACPSVQTCYAVGFLGTEGNSPPPGVSNDVIATHDGGQTWQTIFTSDVTRVRSGVCRAGGASCVYIGNISCPTMSNCYALGFGSPPQRGRYPGSSLLLTTTNGGLSWRLRVIHVYSSSAAIACPAVTTCYVAGPSSAVTTDRGLTWRAQSEGPGGYVSMITCPAVQVCYTVGFRSATKTTTDAGTVAVTRNAGTMWRTSYYPDTDMYGISCPTARICYGAGGLHGGSSASILVTRDEGSSWQRENPSFGTLEYARAIACPGPDTCYAVSSQGGIYRGS